MSRAGGMGVLGCVRFNDPEELETTLRWMDENTDGKPYGVDVVMPAKIPTEGTKIDIDALIPQAHRDFVAKTSPIRVPPCPTTWCAVKARSGGCTRWPARTSRLRSSTDQADRQRPRLAAEGTSSTSPTRPESRWPRWPVRLNTPAATSTTVWTSSSHRATRPAGTPVRSAPWCWAGDRGRLGAPRSRRRRDRRRPSGRRGAGPGRRGSGWARRGSPPPNTTSGRAPGRWPVRHPGGSARGDLQRHRCAAASTPASRRGC